VIVVVFISSFLGSEFSTKRFLVTCAIYTLINEWDISCTESSEGVHFLGWVGQKEDNWRNFKITVEEYQWIVCKFLAVLISLIFIA